MEFYGEKNFDKHQVREKEISVSLRQGAPERGVGGKMSMTKCNDLLVLEY